MAGGGLGLPVHRFPLFNQHNLDRTASTRLLLPVLPAVQHALQKANELTCLVHRPDHSSGMSLWNLLCFLLGAPLAWQRVQAEQSDYALQISAYRRHCRWQDQHRQ